MIITTTPSVDGKKIVEYCDIIVVASRILNVSTSLASFDPTLEKARKNTLHMLQVQAEALGADAVVGIDIDYEFVVDEHAGKGSLVLSISGTAVKLG